MPQFLYGTAWKEDATERLVRLAIESGFRGIDTANQRRHYVEAAVGSAIACAVRDGLVRRDELFLQTKFTYVDSQDHRVPYNPSAGAPTQVRQSFASSLDHLQTDTIDSYILHGPSQRRGLGVIDWEVWRAMEELHAAGRTRFLGISNIALDQLQELCGAAKVKPGFVQNRCFARMHWDREIRAFCREQRITYEGFSLLTANVRELQHRAFWDIVERHGKTPAQIVFRFAIDAGMLPLTGTTSADHMREDLAVFDFELAPEEVQVMENIAYAR